MSTELEAATYLVDATADTLRAQLLAGTLTPDEYAEAIRCVSPDQEEGTRCLYCSRAAYIGKTCPDHADRKAALEAAHNARPTVNLARYCTPVALTAAVIAALERTGRVQPAQRFAQRAACAPGMNALCQLARDYVRLETRIV